MGSLNPMLLRSIFLLRARLHSLHLRWPGIGLVAPSARALCTTASASESTWPAGESFSSSADKPTPKYAAARWDDPDYCKWKDKEREILRDVEPIILLAKHIIHSDRYMDGEQISLEDEKLVVERLLAYHPHYQDKIGCGIDSIMVDRHPQFRHTRCLFVIRTDGVWIDFSYQKCLRAYIRDKYPPSHAERFIREHFKRGSG